jgi:hypothetical protein
VKLIVADKGIDLDGKKHQEGIIDPFFNDHGDRKRQGAWVSIRIGYTLTLGRLYRCSVGESLGNYPSKKISIHQLPVEIK